MPRPSPSRMSQRTRCTGAMTSPLCAKAPTACSLSGKRRTAPAYTMLSMGWATKSSAKWTICRTLADAWREQTKPFWSTCRRCPSRPCPCAILNMSSRWRSHAWKVPSSAFLSSPKTWKRCPSKPPLYTYLAARTTYTASSPTIRSFRCRRVDWSPTSCLATILFSRTVKCSRRKWKSLSAS